MLPSCFYGQIYAVSITIRIVVSYHLIFFFLFQLCFFKGSHYNLVFICMLQLGFMLLALIWKFDFPPFMVLIIAILNDGLFITFYILQSKYL